MGRSGFSLRAVTSPYNPVDQSSPEPNVRAQLHLERPDAAGMSRAPARRRRK